MSDPAVRASWHADEVEHLRRQLEYAESAIEALVAGQVDAAVSRSGEHPVLLREAQVALRRSEQRYRDLIARSPAIVCELAPDGTTLYVNPLAAELLGRDERDLHGRPWWHTLQPEWPAATIAEWWERFTRGNVSDLEMQVTSGDGEKRTIVWNSTNRYAADGTLESVLAFGLDISERKRAEEAAARLAAESAALAEAERARNRAALLAEASRVLASSLDYQATLRSVAGLVVPTLGDWCAVDILTAGGTIERIAIQHEDPAKVEWATEFSRRRAGDPEAPYGVRKVLRTGEAELYPDIAELLLGESFDDGPIEELRSLGLRSALIVPLTNRGETIGAITLVSAESGQRYDDDDLTIAKDLAQRVSVAVENARLYEEARAAREEAESANLAKSQFLASMSHELRTPLNAIAGYVALLEEGIHGTLNEKQRDYLRRSRRSQEHLLGLINDVLNFAKLEAGHIQFKFRDVSLGKALAEVDDLVAPQVGAKGLAYENRAGQRDLCIRADGDKLRQIMVNLVSNAVKFTPRGGSICITCEERGDMAAIAVEDTGIGIPGDKLEAIFEPFVQVGKELAREGTGLGLSISRQLAREMGGDLSAESTIGAGSVFTLTVPRVAVG